jgi:hypothetical protein
MGFKLANLCNKFILLLPHSLELFLHDGILVNNGMLRLELIVVALIILLILLVDLHPGEWQCEFSIDAKVQETSLNSRSWSSKTVFRNLPTSL